jgi:hypothetical protein
MQPVWGLSIRLGSSEITYVCRGAPPMGDGWFPVAGHSLRKGAGTERRRPAPACQWTPSDAYEDVGLPVST